MNRSPESILICPVVSEKGMALAEEGIYAFRVPIDAGKIAIKRAIESLFNVRVEQVRCVRIPRKERIRYTRRTRVVGRTAAGKKAYVKLKKGFTLPNFFEPG